MRIARSSPLRSTRDRGRELSSRTLLLSAVLIGVLCPAATHAGDVVEYYHLDAIGNVRLITDQNGNIVERHDYYPFGEECTTGPCASNPGVGAGQARKFTGKERDTETGLDYFGARYYGAKIGRFTTVDPVYTWQENLLDPQRWNRYAYARNNPIRYVDPDGRAIETPWDILNIGIGVVSFGANVVAGNAGGAAVDAAGIVVDVLATAVPGVPGGAGTAIKAARAADKAADAVKAVERAADAKQLVRSYRPKPRKSTLQSNWDEAAPGPTGGKLCPSCADEVTVPPNSGQPRDWHNSHLDPPWHERRGTMVERGRSKERMRDVYNEGTQLECPSCNLERGSKRINP